MPGVEKSCLEIERDVSKLKKGLTRIAIGREAFFYEDRKEWLELYGSFPCHAIKRDWLGVKSFAYLERFAQSK